MSITVFTLSSDDYFPGLVALVNSLRLNGFDGEIIVGREHKMKYEHLLTDVKFVDVDSKGYWLSVIKSSFLLENPCDNFVFFDSDIIVNNNKFITKLNEWVLEYLVLSIESILPSNDYRRINWNNANNTPSDNILNDYYYNGGFIAGNWKRDKEFLELWQDSTLKNLKPPSNLFQNDQFPTSDQDTLNSVLQNYKNKIITLTYPDVWYSAVPAKPFIHVGGFDNYAFLHCTGNEKTWLLKTLPTRSPNSYDKSFYNYAIKENRYSNIPFELPWVIRKWIEQNNFIRVIQKIKNAISL